MQFRPCVFCLFLVLPLSCLFWFQYMTVPALPCLLSSQLSLCLTLSYVLSVNLISTGTWMVGNENTVSVCSVLDFQNRQIAHLFFLPQTERNHFTTRPRSRLYSNKRSQLHSCGFHCLAAQNDSCDRTAGMNTTSMNTDPQLCFMRAWNANSKSFWRNLAKTSRNSSWRVGISIQNKHNGKSGWQSNAQLAKCAICLFLWLFIWFETYPKRPLTPPPNARFSASASRSWSDRAMAAEGPPL